MNKATPLSCDILGGSMIKHFEKIKELIWKLEQKVIS